MNTGGDLHFHWGLIENKTQVETYRFNLASMNRKQVEQNNQSKANKVRTESIYYRDTYSEKRGTLAPFLMSFFV